MRGRRLAVMSLAVALAAAAPSQAREVEDMAGHRLILPDGPPRVFGALPPLTSLAALVNPEAVVALNRPLGAEERPYLAAALAERPVIGGWFGNGGGVSLERLAQLHPDLVLAEQGGPTGDEVADSLAPLGLAVARLRWEGLDDQAPLLRALGRLLDRPERGEALARFAEQTLAEVDAAVAALPPERRPSVYYAQGPDGLHSACADSVHLEVIRRAGGRPVVTCSGPLGRKAQQTLSLDRVIALAPEVIIATDPAFLDHIRQDPGWAQVKAVAEGRVYLAPSRPYGWVDRPPLFTRLIGLWWVYDRLQGGQRLPAAQEAFFRLFFGTTPP